MTDALLTPKELAGALRKGIRYVRAMVARGFSMPGGTATLAEARAWLARNPPPFSAEWEPTPPPETETRTAPPRAGARAHGTARKR